MLLKFNHIKNFSKHVQYYTCLFKNKFSTFYNIHTHSTNHEGYITTKKHTLRS